jgi:hypothetical protein
MKPNGTAIEGVCVTGAGRTYRQAGSHLSRCPGCEHGAVTVTSRNAVLRTEGRGIILPPDSYVSGQGESKEFNFTVIPVELPC